MVRTDRIWWLAAPVLRGSAWPVRKPFNCVSSTIAPFTTSVAARGGGKVGKIKKNTGFKWGARLLTRQGKQRRKNIVGKKENRPAPGERRASKKRVVLSNVNALEIPDLQDIGPQNEIDARLQLKILGIPGSLVDRLRALEAFRAKQSWAMFKRPAMLIRKETVKVATMLRTAAESGSGQRLVITGERGSGKSVLLLQATALALLKDWVVISIPEAEDLTNAHTDYGPVPGSKPTLYYQKSYTAHLLDRAARANPILKELKVETEQTRRLPHADAIHTLEDLCKGAVFDHDQAWPIFQALWAELSCPGRPPVLLSLDGLSHVMRYSDYRSSTFKPIHAHDLTIVNWYMQYLSGQRSLANGGIVIAATSSSTTFPNKTLDERLAQIELEQADAAERLAYDPASHPMAAFLEATAQDSSPIPRLDPYAQHDLRVLEVLGGAVASSASIPPSSAASVEGNSSKEAISKSTKATMKDTAKSSSSDSLSASPTPPSTTSPRVLRCSGLDRVEARTMMEYWARSGMMRASVTAAQVAQQYAISGGGIVGELERGCFRMRM